MNRKNTLLISFFFVIAVLLVFYKVMSWYFQPLKHEKFILYLTKEKALFVPFQEEVEKVKEKMGDRLGINLLINLPYNAPDSFTVYTYFINIDTLANRLKPKSYDEMIKLIKNNFRAIENKRIIYGDNSQLNLMKRTGNIEETLAGILSHELGHLYSSGQLEKRINELYEKRIANMISSINSALSLVDNNETKEALSIINKIENSDDKNDLRVVERLAFYYLTTQQYELAYKWYNKLVEEGKTIISNTDENYLSLLEYKRLVAHCLTALNLNNKAQIIYREIAKEEIAKRTHISIIAKAGMERAKHSSKIPEASGLVIISIKKNSEGARLGLKVGDILVSINGSLLHLPKDLGELLKKNDISSIYVFKAKSNTFKSLTTNKNRLGVTIATI